MDLINKHRTIIHGNSAQCQGTNRNTLKTQSGCGGKGYTIVGYTGRPLNQYHNNPSLEGALSSSIPIILPDHEIPNVLFARLGPASGNGQVLVLPELYKVEWVHGKLNLYDMLRKQIYLCDNNENDLFASHGSTPPPIEKENLDKWLNEKDMWDETTNTVIGKSRKDKIIEIETTYPGLFIPIFIDDNTRFHYTYENTYVNAF
jgi:hypothetical protein